MKKIINIIFLMIICFLPVMVDAKATFEFKEELIDCQFLFKDEKKGEYYFLNSNYSFNNDGVIKILDEDLELIKEDKMFESEEYNEELMVSSKYFDEFYKYYSDIIDSDSYDSNYVFDFDTNISFSVDYQGKRFYYYTNDESSSISFNEDLDFTKKLLGKKYDVYLWAENHNYYTSIIREVNDYYIIYYSCEDSYDLYVAILDENLDIVQTFSNERYFLTYVYDDLIYIIEDNIYLKVYNLNRQIVGNMTIESDYISEPNSCFYLYPGSMSVSGTDLFINYVIHECPPARINGSDESFYDNAKGRALEFLTLVYDINFEIDKVESNNGDFTYVEKIDESGKSYVELKITPQEGYEVDKIIVTDANGNEIEVRDNKFYKPSGDVKIEIQYKEVAEYIQIPDTFLGRNLTIIFIGIILIGLGIYTVNYVKN